ncbi:MAG: choice-of-anchor J domain-containing protein [Bacteroidia bacterium]|nr:choice-of-anchor J domain-containing protein [Bacteroidia bacterium]
MKKLYVFIYVKLVIAACINNLYSQLPNGSTGPDFTATDINGNTYHLYDYLNDGKPVIMDIFATWCSPCWNYHNSHALRDLYNQYGPPGTNELMVFFIEGDATTTLADLQGTGTNTQGDWVTGTPYPIIDNATIADLYQITYFPTVYLICPNRITNEIGAVSASELYSGASGCPPLTFDAEFISSKKKLVVNETIQITNTTILNTTQWTWTFQGVNPSSSTLENPSVTYTTPGTYDVSLTVSDGTQSDTETKTGYITVLTMSAGFSLNFESCVDFSYDFEPWTVNDQDGETQYGSNDYDFANEGGTGAFMAFNPSQTIPSASGDAALQPHGGQRFGACFSELTDYLPNHDWIISPRLELGTNTSLSFWVKTYKNTWGLERYKVGISTTNNDPASFTFISTGSYIEAPITWTQANYDLSAYDNQPVYIAIQCVSSDAFIFMVDDIQISSTLVDIDELAGKTDIRIFPNPAADYVSISGAEKSFISIYDILGNEIIKTNIVSSYEPLDIKDVADGTYIVCINTGKQIIYALLIIEH